MRMIQQQILLAFCIACFVSFAGCSDDSVAAGNAPTSNATSNTTNDATDDTNEGDTSILEDARDATGSSEFDDVLADSSPTQDTAEPEDVAVNADMQISEDSSEAEDTLEPEDSAVVEEDTAVAPDTSGPCTEVMAWIDTDEDGQGNPTQPAMTYCLDDGPPEGYAVNNIDCDDNDPEVYTGARRCAPDGTAVEICANGQFRTVSLCGFEKACFEAVDGFHCGCNPDARRCEDWVVRLCAPDRLQFLAHDCRPTGGVCESNDCPDCTVAFAYLDSDSDGDGDLHTYVTYCTQAGLPDGYVATGTDCQDGNADVGDGDAYCDDDGVTLRRCQEGRSAVVEVCGGRCEGSACQ